MKFSNPVPLSTIAQLIGAELIGNKEGMATGINEIHKVRKGDIVFVEVETICKPLAAGEVFGTVEAVKTVSDLYLPVSGTITELNPELANAPELINQDPYEKGWMIKMTVDNPEDVAALMDAAGYESLVG